MKEFILKFKNQQTIPTDGIDLWKTILYSVEKDKDGDVQKAARKLLGLDRDRYAEIHGAPKQKEKKKLKPLLPHRPSSQTRKPGLQQNLRVFWVNMTPYKYRKNPHLNLNKVPK